MGKRNAVSATQPYLPRQQGAGTLPMAGAITGNQTARGNKPKQERTLLGMPGQTLLGLPKALPAALRSVWPGRDPEPSLVGLSRQVEARAQKPRANAGLKPPAPPPRAASSERPRGRHAGDPTDHDIQLFEIHTAPQRAAAGQPRKRSLFGILTLVSLGALAVAACVYLVRSPTDALDTTKAAWQELETSARQQLGMMPSAASPTPAPTAPEVVPSLVSPEAPAATPEPASSEAPPTEETGVTTSPEPAEVDNDSETRSHARAHKRRRHRKVND